MHDTFDLEIKILAISDVDGEVHLHGVVGVAGPGGELQLGLDQGLEAGVQQLKPGVNQAGDFSNQLRVDRLVDLLRFEGSSLGLAG